MNDDPYSSSGKVSENSVYGTPRREALPDNANSLPISTTSSAEPPVPILIPDGGFPAWITVIGASAAMMATYGVIFSIGTFQTYLATHQLRAFSDRDVGWISAVNIFISMFLAVRCGPLFDRLGPRWLLAVPSIVFVAGMIGMSFPGCSRPGDICLEGHESTRAYVVLMLTWGVVCGISAASISTAALAVIAHWFEARRGLAAGLVYAGTSIGGIVFPLLMRATLETLGWGWSVRIVALIALVLLVTANILVRGRTEVLNKGKQQSKFRLVELNCFRDVRFLWVTIGLTREQLPTREVFNGRDRLTRRNQSLNMSLQRLWECFRHGQEQEASTTPRRLLCWQHTMGIPYPPPPSHSWSGILSLTSSGALVLVEWSLAPFRTVLVDSILSPQFWSLPLASYMAFGSR